MKGSSKKPESGKKKVILKDLKAKNAAQVKGGVTKPIPTSRRKELDHRD